MAATFYSADSITPNCRTVPDLTNFTDVDIDDVYEVEKCVQWIRNNRYMKVALQFPDTLLHCSTRVAQNIEKQLKTTESPAVVFILADTSYGSCCVDEVAAEHVSSDALIHFGPSCLTPVNRLPTLYVFGKEPIDENDVLAQFRQVLPDRTANVVLFYSVVYYHAIGRVYKSLKSHFVNLVLSELVIPSQDVGTPVDTNCYVSFGSRRVLIEQNTPISVYNVFYIGQEGPTLTNLMLTLNSSPFYTYDPGSKHARKETVDVNRSLRKRYYFVEVARDAKIVGLVMGTLGVTGYLNVLERLKILAKLADKKVYTIAVGCLNPAKLANFPEIDVFVLIACPENSLLDAKEFYKPIVTPYEFELACNNERQWTGEYVTDFRELMPGAKHHVELPKHKEENCNVSLISGKLTHLSVATGDYGTKLETNNLALVAKTDLPVAEIHCRAAGEYLANRSWHGLEPKVGETEMSTIVQGRRGIASAYEDEIHNEN